MDREEQDEKATYTVVVNQEEQFALWPESKEIPKGWRAAGKTGVKAECLAFVQTVWTDMTPASLRRTGGGTTTSA